MMPGSSRGNVLVLAACAATIVAAAVELPDGSPMAVQGPIVRDGAWRFTAMSERLIRIEYDENQQFVDEPTVAFLRSSPLGTWTNSSADGDGWAVLSTGTVSLRYLRGSAPANGSVLVTNSKHTWTWGDDPEVGNLRGTARTLDGNAETLDLNCHRRVSPATGMPNSDMECTWGIISQLGWAIVNDTGAPVWRDGFWYAASRNTTDISVFSHGHDFQGAMRDFYHAAGPPPLPPRYAFGTIFTRWFDFDSDSAMALIDEFESRSMPLDAWIFDMNWHVFGPWGSFSWNVDSYPKLQEMLDWFQSRQLPIGVNTHDSCGIIPSEVMYNEFCAAIGCTPGASIPFDLYNKTFAMAMENIAWRALQTKEGKQGVDFSWIDWQQGEHNTFERTLIPNMNPTIMLNMLRSTDPVRHGENKRSLILSRFGGLGSHRYPVGFSGDQHHTWKGLAFLPYFTSTAANVGFNYWSHDTVGGAKDRGADLSADYELAVRWVQTSAWSPVLRFHDKGQGVGDCATTDACARIVPWDLPNAFFAAVRDAAQRRDELLPYIYTAAFDGMSSGLALVRPMYYHNSNDNALYGLDHQYLFGPDMIISPISAPSGPEAQGFEQALGAVTWTVYAPKSTSGWVDRLNGDFVVGNTSSVYGIFDVPGLLRQGAVIPMRPTRARGKSSLARAREVLTELEFRVAPADAFYTGGALKGSGSVVDDDGMTTDYMKGVLTRTQCNYTFQGRSFSVQLSQSGDFQGRPQHVMVRLSFPQLPPLIVSAVSGSAAPIVTYDHQLLGAVLTFNEVDLRTGLAFEAAINDAYPSSVLPNLEGALGRIRRARYVKDAMDAANIPYGQERANLTAIALMATHMNPAFAGTLPQLWDGAIAQATTLLSTSTVLKNDHRRSKFIADFLQLHRAEQPPAASSLVV